MRGNARLTAAAALCRVHRGGWTNLTAKQALADSRLAERDRAFAGALFYGTVERLATLDYLLAPLLAKPPERLDVEVRAVLETGLYQLMYMDTPPSAVVNEGVKLTRLLKKSSASGLVNAVLRKCAALPRDENGPVLGSFETERQRVEVLYSLGPRVAREIMESLPDDYERFLAACFRGGGFGIQVNRLKTTAADVRRALEGRGAKLVESPIDGYFYCQMPGGVANEALFQQGCYYVQGAASRIACALLGVRPGHRVLDVCAAPGGKASSLYIDGEGEVDLIACDVQAKRVELMRQGFARLGFDKINALQADGTVYHEGFGPRDRVLCDVPCSGLGTLGAKPDIRYSGGEGFEALPGLQYAILACAAGYLAPGGRLVYSTCTVRPQENEQVVQRFIESNPAFRMAAPAFVPPGARVGRFGMLLLPEKGEEAHGSGSFVVQDGFFVATLERM